MQKIDSYERKSVKKCSTDRSNENFLKSNENKKTYKMKINEKKYTALA